MPDSALNAPAPRETPAAMPALVLANEACLRRHDLSVDELIRLCAAAGLDAEVRESHDLPRAEDLAARLAERPARLLVAGGDGTIHHLVNAFAASPEVAWPPFGIVPLGTANDFARSLGLSGDWRAALEVAARGAPRPIDLGWVNGRRFLNAVHLGTMAESTRRVWPWLKRGVRGGAYGLAVATTAWRIRPFEASWIVGDVDGAGWALHLAIANGRYFGGGMPISPAATLEDGQLDLAIVPALPRGWFMQAAKRLVAGQGLSLPGIWRLRGEAVAVTCADAPGVSLDGEHFETGPTLDFRVLPGAIAVYLPGAAPAP